MMNKKKAQVKVSQFGSADGKPDIGLMSDSPLPPTPPVMSYTEDFPHDLQTYKSIFTEEHKKGFLHLKMEDSMDEEALARLSALQSLIQDHEVYQDESGDYGRELKPHITILYGITDQDYYKFKDEIHPPLVFSLGEIGSFRSPETPYDVLFVTVEKAADLHEVFNYLRSEHGLKSSYPEYKPHMTLAYVKKGMCRELEGIRPFPNEWYQTIPQ